MSTAAGSGDHGSLPKGPGTGRDPGHDSGHDSGHDPGPEPGHEAGPGTGTGAPHKAGAFDIRVFIGSLIGIYGLVLTIAGLIGPSAGDLAKSGGVNINLWAGLGMIAVAAGFVLWARLRPVVVPPEAGSHEGQSAAH
jgi:hypothetical protein